MLIVAYDISDTKLRTTFSKFLERYGFRLQYSVFEIKNSNRYQKIIVEKIEGRFAKLFDQEDSVLIFNVNDGNVRKYGSGIHHDKDYVFF